MDSAERFFDLWEWCGGKDSAAERALLEQAYADPKRTYHNWRHINAMLQGMDHIRRAREFTGVLFPEVEMAIFFHDVVYDPKAKDNEKKSADLFRKVSAGLHWASVCDVEAMINATAKHEATTDLSTQLLLDLDLAILGSSPSEYRQHVKGVRQEYSHLSEEGWRIGRKDFLTRFSARPAIFQTGYFNRKLEKQARDNMAAELASLSRKLVAA